MEMRKYGNEMLEKQLKYAELKGNKEYSEMLKTELGVRAAKRKAKLDAKMTKKPEAKKPKSAKKRA